MWALASGWCVWAASFSPDAKVRQWSVIASAWVMLWCMLLVWQLKLTLPRELVHRFASVARLVWTLGLLALLIHVAIAFGVAHRWSHAAAVEHVRSRAGFGGGIVVNYLFCIVWLMDVAWWWWKPASYLERSRWIQWSVNGFLFFLVFNATVVFGTEKLRGLYGFFTVMVLLCFWPMGRLVNFRLWRWLHERNKPGQRPGSESAPGSSTSHSPT
jgi:hypothetical protein